MPLGCAKDVRQTRTRRRQKNQLNSSPKKLWPIRLRQIRPTQKAFHVRLAGIMPGTESSASTVVQRWHKTGPAKGADEP